MPRINEHIFSLAGIQYRLIYYKNDKPRIFKDDQEFQGNKSELLRKYIIELGFSNLLSIPQTTQSLSNYVLNHFSIKKVSAVKKITLRKSIIEKNQDNSNMNNKDSVDQKIEEHLNKLDWGKIQDKNVKKLLIISCSDSKNLGGEHSNSKNYFSNNENYNSLIKDREERVKEYNRLIDVEPNYLFYKDKQKYIKRNKKPIPKDYFKHCLEQGLTMPAIERYNGRFYSKILKQLYLEKNQNSNLHILIISGLYGVIEFRDSIIDYHLEISKRPLWTMQSNTIIHNTIANYILENQIDNEMVFYSLSQAGNHSYVNALKPIEDWKNLWITHGRGATAVRFLRDHFLPEL